MSSFSKQIDANIRDVDHEYYSGSWSADDSSAWNLGNPGLVTRNIGLRFTNVTIPQGSTIDSAIIRFKDGDTKSVNLTAKIQGIDEDNTAEFVISPENSARTRTKTTASVNWNGTINQSTGSNRDTPDIKTIVQEIVDRGSWASGNAMAFFLSDNGSSSGHYLTVDEYDDGSTQGATLIITYTEPGGDVVSERGARIIGVGLYPEGSTGIKLAKDGYTIDSTNIEDYNLWTKYPPKTFLEQKTQAITVTPALGDGTPRTVSVAHSYGFVPLVLARISDDVNGNEYFLPASNFAIDGGVCDVDHELRVAFSYTVTDTEIIISYTLYCGALVMGGGDEAISSNKAFTVKLDFYMWELGSPWPE